MYASTSTSTSTTEISRLKEVLANARIKFEKSIIGFARYRGSKYYESAINQFSLPLDVATKVVTENGHYLQDANFCGVLNVCTTRDGNEAIIANIRLNIAS
jgi:hypothetical protein